MATFVCDHCGNDIIESIQEFKSHVKLCKKIHHFTNGNQCIVCSQDFTSQDGLYQHFVDKHRNLAQMEPEPEKDMNHQLSSIGKQKKQCPHCSNYFGELKKEHVRKCKKWSPFVRLGDQCGICQENKKYSSRRFLYQHMAMKHGEAYFSQQHVTKEKVNSNMMDADPDPILNEPSSQSSEAGIDLIPDLDEALPNTTTTPNKANVEREPNSSSQSRIMPDLIPNLDESLTSISGLDKPVSPPVLTEPEPLVNGVNETNTVETPLCNSSRRKMLDETEVEEIDDENTLEPTSCQKCQKTFKLAIELKKHENNCMKNSKKVVKRPKSPAPNVPVWNWSSPKCQHCQKTFNRPSKAYFKKHVESCKKYQKFIINGDQCGICLDNVIYSKKGSLQKHLTNKHQQQLQQSTDVIEEKNECQKCHKTFMLGVNLKKHEMICKKAFTNILSTDIDMHDYPKCKSCQRSFKLVIELKNHKCKKKDHLQQPKEVLMPSQERANISNFQSPNANECGSKAKECADISSEVEKESFDQDVIAEETDELMQDDLDIVNHKIEIDHGRGPLLMPSQERANVEHGNTSNFQSPNDNEVIETDHGPGPLLNSQDRAVVVFQNHDHPQNMAMMPRQPLQILERDPRIITKLYRCPFCRGLLANLSVAQDHVTQFHRISLADRERMGKNGVIEEISVNQIQMED